MATKRKAFTLIEIMIVVVIIGLLAIALFPKLMGAIGKTSDGARKIELQNWATILADYRTSNPTYPVSTGTCMNYDNATALGIDIDKNKFPKDPNPGNEVAGCQGYFYYKSISVNGVPNSSYVLFAKMENDSKGNYDQEPSSVSSKESIVLQDQGKYYIDIGL